MQIAIPVFDRLTALDAIGPYEVLQRIPEATITFVGTEVGPIRTENGMLGVMADRTLDELPEPDVIIVPGGIGTRALLDGGALVDWVRHAHGQTRYTTSVCTGSLVLAAAGVLDGVDATTHWAAYDLLRGLGANPVTDRVVERGKVITAAGVSAGIDMALRLAELLADDTTARALQLMIEYDPKPPFDAGAIGSPQVDDAVLARVAEIAEVRQ